MHQPRSCQQLDDPAGASPALAEHVDSARSGDHDRRMRVVWNRVLSETTTRSVLAVADQAFYSGTNFFTSVIVGRLAGVDQLGIYTLGFTFVIMLAAAQEALITTPYLIRFNQLRTGRQRRFAGSILVHGIVGALVSAVGVMAVGALAAGIPRFSSLGPALLALSIVLPWLLLREFTRRFLLARLQMTTVCILDFAIAVLHFCGLYLLIRRGTISAPATFATAGVACGVVSLVMLVILRRHFVIRRQSIAVDLHQNWRLARWIFVALIVHILQLTAVIWVVAFQLGTAAAGLLAACMSIVNLSNPLARSMNNVLMPRAALAFAQDGPAEVRHICFRMTVFLGIVMAFFCLVLVVTADSALQMLYGSHYVGHRLMVTLLALAALLRAMEMSSYNGLLVIGFPQTNFWINTASLVLLLLMAPALIMIWGVAGAAVTIFVVAALAAISRWIAFLAMLRVVSTSRASAMSPHHEPAAPMVGLAREVSL